MMLRDTDGKAFDASQVETVLERYDDAALGEIARIRLKNGSIRLVGLAELAMAFDDETVGANFPASIAPPSIYG